MKSLLATVKSFIANLLLWSFFIGGLAASTASGAVLDGTAKTAATFAGIAVSLLTGSRIAKKPKIKAFLSKTSTLWFLFLFNGGVAVARLLRHGRRQGHRDGGRNGPWSPWARQAA
ncbi:hypothetical protein ACRAWF_05025 [Streptomyces sp. L7]